MTRQIEFFVEELGYFVIAKLKDDYFVDFDVYEVSGTDAETGIPLFGQSFSETCLDVEPIAEVSVKWDGCSDWWFGDYQHQCSRKGVENFGKILCWCWDKTKELIPDKWDPQ